MIKLSEFLFPNHHGKQSLLGILASSQPGSNLLSLISIKDFWTDSSFLWHSSRVKKPSPFPALPQHTLICTQSINPTVTSWYRGWGWRAANMTSQGKPTKGRNHLLVSIRIHLTVLVIHPLLSLWCALDSPHTIFYFVTSNHWKACDQGPQYAPVSSLSCSATDSLPLEQGS